MARAILVLMALGVAACAALGPALTPVQEAELSQVQALVDGAARAYRLGSVPVVVGPVAGAVAAYRQGTILVDPDLLGSPHRDAVIAHELGHAVLGHGHQPTGFTDRAATLGEWARLAMPRELDANAKSVEILTRVKGWPEATSLRIVAEKLRSVVRAQQRGAPVGLGHLPACEELRDLLARFPPHQARFAGWNCPA